MSTWNEHIPEEEVSNVLSVYWQMLQIIETECKCNEHLVEGAYKVLNRAGISDAQPKKKS